MGRSCAGGFISFVLNSGVVVVIVVGILRSDGDVKSAVDFFPNPIAVVGELTGIAVDHRPGLGYTGNK